MGIDESFLSRRQAERDKDRELDEMRRRMALFAAHVKAQGRIRVSRRDWEDLGAYALRFKRDGEFFIVTCEGAAEEAG